MSDFLRDYLNVVWFAAIAIVLASSLLGISAVLRPSKPSAEKNMAYESGVNPVGDGWSQSQVRYYIFALLFVVFDVEAVFIFPWAVQLEPLTDSYGVQPLVSIFRSTCCSGAIWTWVLR